MSDDRHASWWSYRLGHQNYVDFYCLRNGTDHVSFNCMEGCWACFIPSLKSSLCEICIIDLALQSGVVCTTWLDLTRLHLFINTYI